MPTDLDSTWEAYGKYLRLQMIGDCQKNCEGLEKYNLNCQKQKVSRRMTFIGIITIYKNIQYIVGEIVIMKRVPINTGESMKLQYRY